MCVFLDLLIFTTNGWIITGSGYCAGQKPCLYLAQYEQGGRVVRMTAQKTIYGQRQISSSSQFYNPLNPTAGRPGLPSVRVVTVSTINCNYHHHHPWYCQLCRHRTRWLHSQLSLSMASVKEVVCTVSY